MLSEFGRGGEQIYCFGQIALKITSAGADLYKAGIHDDFPLVQFRYFEK